MLPDFYISYRRKLQKLETEISQRRAIDLGLLPIQGTCLWKIQSGCAGSIAMNSSSGRRVSQWKERWLGGK
jgi:hypothetical protein